ncbi:unnamed protein product, partial [Cuscuta europaea]
MNQFLAKTNDEQQV